MYGCTMYGCIFKSHKLQKIAALFLKTWFCVPNAGEEPACREDHSTAWVATVC